MQTLAKKIGSYLTFIWEKKGKLSYLDLDKKGKFS